MEKNNFLTTKEAVYKKKRKFAHASCNHLRNSTIKSMNNYK